MQELSTQTAQTSVQTYNFLGHDLRVVFKDNNPWFVAKDVATMINVSNVSQMLQNLDNDEKGIYETYTLGGDQKMSIISESGLYSVIVRSNKPEAKAFKKWVTSEVLPAIRKTGSYSVATNTSIKQESTTTRIQDLKTMVDSINHMSSLTFNQRVNASLMQHAIDYCQNLLQQELQLTPNLLPSEQPLTLGVVEIAKRYLGVSNLKRAQEQTLGKYVSQRMQGKTTAQERIVNGEFRVVKAYEAKHHEEVCKLVKEWLDAKAIVIGA